jgi:hypothetical protein
MSDARDLAFVEPAAEFAGLKLRPFSAGTMTLCRALKLNVVLGGGDELTEEEKQKQLVALLFIQSAPIETVKKAVKLARTDYQAFLDDYLLPFELELPVTALPKIIAELLAAFEAVNAAEFDVKGGGDASDPNS